MRVEARHIHMFHPFRQERMLDGRTRLASATISFLDSMDGILQLALTDMNREKRRQSGEEVMPEVHVQGSHYNKPVLLAING